MKLFVLFMLSLVSFEVALGAAASEPNANKRNVGIPDCIWNTCVKIDAKDQYGSGVVFNNGKYTYIWGCAHVVAPNQTIKTVMDLRTGKPTLLVTYADAAVSQNLVEDGRHVGERLLFGKIIRYSKREDLSLIKLYATNRFKQGVVFYEGVPVVGSDIWSVTCPGASPGHTTTSKGIVSAIGRLRLSGAHDVTTGIIYDQVQIAGTYGSSGGGVFCAHSNRCIGLLTEYLVSPTQYSASMFCMAPSRRIIAFAQRNRCMYAIDSTLPVPHNEEVITDDVVPVPKDWPR